MQGEEGHETAEPTRCFVRIDSMSYAVDIHRLTRNSLCELRLKRRYTGSVGCDGLRIR
uniref:DUF5431 family protein n=1 Tax=Escherichia coli TaxID=562 RepID=UPI001F3F884D|nr:DUF5431 family protein [Escherichia coli]